MQNRESDPGDILVDMEGMVEDTEDLVETQYMWEIMKTVYSTKIKGTKWFYCLHLPYLWFLS